MAGRVLIARKRRRGVAQQHQNQVAALERLAVIVKIGSPLHEFDDGLYHASRLVIVSPLLRPSSVGGQVAVSSGLLWDASGLSVRLQDPRVEQLRIDGVTGNDARTVERISAAVVQEALQGFPLHTFRPEELRFGLKVQSITIGVDEIKVQFE